MAIHDVDNSPNREAPMPNTHDLSFVSGGLPIINQPRQAHGTNSSNYVTDASSFSSATAIKSGDFRLALSGTTSITVGSVSGSSVGVYNTSSTVTIPHGLSFIPVPMCFSFDGSIYTPSDRPIQIETGGNAIYGLTTISCETDATNLYIEARSVLTIVSTFTATLAGGTFPVRYYLFQQTAN